MSKERASDSAEVASWEGMEWLVSWKKPNRELAERRLERRVSAGSEREISGGVVAAVVVGGDERRVGRERVRVGVRRWRRHERGSGASEVERRLGWAEGVGGGAAVVA